MNKDQPTEAASAKARDLMVPFSHVNDNAAETRHNTIVTVDKDSTTYKLKLMGDSRPEFFINGRLLPPDEMEHHLLLISSLKKELEKRNTDE